MCADLKHPEDMNVARILDETVHLIDLKMPMVGFKEPHGTVQVVECLRDPQGGEQFFREEPQLCQELHNLVVVAGRD